MFVRKKPNKSGSVSVHIVEKKTGKYRLVRAVGCSAAAQEVERLFEEAHRMIPDIARQQSFGFVTETDKHPTRCFLW